MEELSSETKCVLEWITRLHEQYGDVVGFRTPFGYHVMISRPEHLEYVFHSQNFQRISPLRIVLGNGLLASSGPYWRQQRRFVQYPFRQQPVLGAGQAMHGRRPPTIPRRGASTKEFVVELTAGSVLWRAAAT